jgi:hypothetical protein
MREEGDDRWGKGGLRWGRFPAMEAETGWGIGAAHGPFGPGNEGGSPGRSRPARRPGLAGLISIGKIKRVFIFEFKYISKFGKTLRISAWRFRMNLDTRIFPKFF